MHNTYICHRRYEEIAMDKNRIILCRGQRLHNYGGVLTYEGRPVCIYRSLNGKKYFAPNDDGEGLERGNLTFALAYAPRFRQSLINGAQQRFTDLELETLNTRWKQYVRQDVDFLLFTDEFFELPVGKLREIAKSVNIEIGG